MFPTEVERGATFFGRLWPEARAVSDPDSILHRAFEVGRTSPLNLLHPGVASAGLRALMKGNPAGLPQGDPFLMPGLFLVQDGAVLWRHRFRHIGDHPDWKEPARVAREHAEKR